VTLQLAAGASVAPQVVVERNGHSLVMRRMVSGAVVEALLSVSAFCTDCPDGTWPKLRTSPGCRPPVTESVPAPMPYPST